MASGDDAVKIVDRADLADDSPMVHDSVEKSSFFWFLKGSSSKKEEQPERVKSENSTTDPSSEKKDKDSSHKQSSNHGSSPHETSGHHHKEIVHDGEGIKTTYDVEEDPSLFEQLKRRVLWNRR